MARPETASQENTSEEVKSEPKKRLKRNDEEKQETPAPPSKSVLEKIAEAKRKEQLENAQRLAGGNDFLKMLN